MTFNPEARLRRSEDSPLDTAAPHEAERSAGQVQGVLELLSPAPKRVLELGSGCGRLVAPLARLGHRVTGIDRDATALASCRAALAAAHADAELVEADFLHWMRNDSGDALLDAILCMGNTFMTIADLDEAIDLLRNAGRRLVAGGLLILDDLPHDLWPQLTAGDWQAGLSEDGSLQLVWHPDDSVFAIRRGPDVDPESWSFNERDVLYRLWTSGALRLAAMLAGLSEPEHRSAHGLLILRPLGL